MAVAGLRRPQRHHAAGRMVIRGVRYGARSPAQPRSRRQTVPTERGGRARALLLSQQVSKGFEDLGSKDPMVVLGGIYALEGVMQAPETQYHLPILEGLCAFVRDPNL